MLAVCVSVSIIIILERKRMAVYHWLANAPFCAKGREREPSCIDHRLSYMHLHVTIWFQTFVIKYTGEYSVNFCTYINSPESLCLISLDFLLLWIRPAGHVRDT